MQAKKYADEDLFPKRLKELIDTHYGGKWTHLAKKAGIALGSFGRYVDGTGKPTFDQIVLICGTSGASPEWLLTGQGPMMRDAPAQDGPWSEAEIVREELEVQRDQWKAEAEHWRAVAEERGARIAELNTGLEDARADKARVWRVAEAAEAGLLSLTPEEQRLLRQFRAAAPDAQTDILDSAQAWARPEKTRRTPDKGAPVEGGAEKAPPRK